MELRAVFAIGVSENIQKATATSKGEKKEKNHSRVSDGGPFSIKIQGEKWETQRAS